MNKLMNISSNFFPLLDICVQADLIVLCFTDTSFFFFYKLKICGNSVSTKSISAIVPIAFAPLVSLSHILLILTTFQNFLIMIIFVGDP